jgi:hypothetical protein
MTSELKAVTIVKSVQSLLAEREAVEEKEKGLIKDLNTVLSKMGYEVVPLRNGAIGAPRRRGRPPGRRRGPGRPPGRRRGRPRARRSGRPAGSSMPRRRGRPPKVAKPSTE